MTLEEIASEAAELDEESRASLASRLLHSLTPPQYDVSDDEVRNRFKEAELDPSVMLSHKDFIAGLKRNAD
jgi:hypothetical protein